MIPHHSHSHSTAHIAVLIAALVQVSAPASQAADAVVQVGAGSYTTALPEGAAPPPATIRRTADAQGKMPSNDWWSALAWATNAFDHFPHPLAVRTMPAGLRLAYPGSHLTANRAGIFGAMPGGANDLIIGHSAAAAFPPPLPDGWSDWFINLQFRTNGHSLRVSYGHGSPFVFAMYAGGQPRILFDQPPKIFSGDEASPTLGVTVNGRHYGLFGPTGARWQGLGTTALTCDTAKLFCSVALLPDNTPATLAQFQRHAHAHVTDTRVDWSYDPASSSVVTTFRVTTVPREGDERGTLFALYPHQWRNATTPLLPLTYGSVRGTMKLAAGTSFTTRMTFPGVLPALPDAGGIDRQKMVSLLRPELERAPAKVTDTYWNGKELGRLATLVAIAEQYDLNDDATKLRQRLQADLKNWFTASGSDGKRKSRGLFYYDTNWGTLIGYPASYGSDRELNDHLFHYGYFVKAAAEIARRDPAWAADARWGGMVKLLIRDFASPDRNDPLFPFLRNFDPYAGHSWASGHARFGDGNNQESSSEAMNAWSGLILWGEATGDTALRDLGVWLFTTELSAIQEYWFDVHGENFPKTYPASVVTMIWSGKGANATWFTADPQMVHGINFLPLHGGSLYLGLYPEYVEKNFRALVAEHGSETFTNWSDILWMYRALSDAPDAVRLAEAAGPAAKPEGGNSPANLAHWIYNLQQFGRVERGVTADSPLYAVFRRGKTRHYVAWNLSREPRTVTFSDGFTLKVKANSYAQATKAVPN
jgi:endoglucanase Acf2